MDGDRGQEVTHDPLFPVRRWDHHFNDVHGYGFSFFLHLRRMHNMTHQKFGKGDVTGFFLPKELERRARVFLLQDFQDTQHCSFIRTGIDKSPDVLALGDVRPTGHGSSDGNNESEKVVDDLFHLASPAMTESFLPELKVVPSQNEPTMPIVKRTAVTI